VFLPLFLSVTFPLLRLRLFDYNPNPFFPLSSSLSFVFIPLITLLPYYVAALSPSPLFSFSVVVYQISRYPRPFPNFEKRLIFFKTRLSVLTVRYFLFPASSSPLFDLSLIKIRFPHQSHCLQSPDSCLQFNTHLPAVVLFFSPFSVRVPFFCYFFEQKLPKVDFPPEQSQTTGFFSSTKKLMETADCLHCTPPLT